MGGTRGTPSSQTMQKGEILDCNPKNDTRYTIGIGQLISRASQRP